jgi:hypothetical protein
VDGPFPGAWADMQQLGMCRRLGCGMAWIDAGCLHQAAVAGGCTDPPATIMCPRRLELQRRQHLPARSPVALGVHAGQQPWQRHRWRQQPCHTCHLAAVRRRWRRLWQLWQLHRHALPGPELPHR